MCPRKFNFSDVQEEEEQLEAISAVLTQRRVAIQDIAIERIAPNPFQARRNFQGLAELVQAIQAQGFTSRLRVRPVPSQPGRYQLVYGERRLRAAKQAGLSTVPCEIAEHSDAELLEIGLAENIQRKDLDPLEEAEAFKSFIDQRGYSIRSLAERLGKDKGYIENRLALLKVPESVQQMVKQRPDTIRAAREIGKVEDAAQQQSIIDEVVAGKLNIKGVQARVQAVTGSVSARADTEPTTSPPTNSWRLLISSTSVAIHNTLVSWERIASEGDAEDKAHLRAVATQARQDIEHILQSL